jgi:hypothetical protein
MGTITAALLLIEFVFFVAMCWVAYHVLKAAIRDGINESNITDALRRQTLAAQPVPNRNPNDGTVTAPTDFIGHMPGERREWRGP